MAQSRPYTRMKVLVVEDEPLLRMMAVDVVAEAGFEAIEAANADEAVEILDERDDIGIIFTDIDMPGTMDGMKLAAAARDRWPPIRVILTSGHRNVSRQDLPEGTVFFPKPYDGSKVAAQLQRMAPDQRLMQ